MSTALLAGDRRELVRHAPTEAAVLRLGVTGHIRLTARTRTLVMAALRAELRRHAGRPLHGVTCLAAGADQLFARALLAENGTYEVVLPARDYRERQVDRSNRATFDHLLRGARGVTYAFRTTCDLAYAAAGDEVLDRSDRLLAVWDGSVGGRGGTGDVVAAARRRGVPVDIVWPTGARRH